VNNKKIEFEATVRAGGDKKVVPLGVINSTQLLPFVNRKVLVSITVVRK